MSAILNVLSGTKNDIQDNQGDISFLCPPVINLIKAQLCDKNGYQQEFAASYRAADGGQPMQLL